MRAPAPALPAPGGAPALSGNGQEPPQGELETRIAELFAELLRIDAVGRDDEGDGETAAKNEQDFVANLNVSALVGHVNSGAMVAAARIYDGQLAARSLMVMDASLILGVANLSSKHRVAAALVNRPQR